MINEDRGMEDVQQENVQKSRQVVGVCNSLLEGSSVYFHAWE